MKSITIFKEDEFCKDELSVMKSFVTPGQDIVISIKRFVAML